VFIFSGCEFSDAFLIFSVLFVLGWFFEAGFESFAGCVQGSKYKQKEVQGSSSASR
jgi:hypothetical protein